MRIQTAAELGVTPCAVQYIDFMKAKHQCDHPHGHEGDHWCFCGHTWTHGLV